jgi:hypothetical protein
MGAGAIVVSFLGGLVWTAMTFWIGFMAGKAKERSENK